MTDESWHLKLRRAEEHLAELDSLIEPFRQSHEYVVREGVKQKGNRRNWSYRMFSPMQPDPYMAVVLGDLLYNVRSALDHVAVALVPRRRKDSTSFPIFTIDPEQHHPADPKGDAARREGWEKSITGMPPKAVARIRLAQPYNADPPAEFEGLSLGPKDHALAVLNAFQNADKHRKLVAIAGALEPAVIRIYDRQSKALIAEGPAEVPALHVPMNGAVIHSGPRQVDVEAAGACRVMGCIGNEKRGPYRVLPDFPKELIRIVRTLVTDLKTFM